VPVAGMRVRLLGPKYPHDLNRDPEVQQRSDADGYKPFWAQPWPASVMLAEHVIGHVEPGADPVLEVGAGLGLAAVALSLAGFHVVATDYDADALGFIRASARLNQTELWGVRPLDWRDPPEEQYGLIVGSDVAYERRSHAPLAKLLRKCLRPGGQAFVSDMNRMMTDEFPAALQREGLGVDVAAAQAQAIPAFDAIDERVMKGRVFRIGR
jgi:ETFB lysine methyltransferase